MTTPEEKNNEVNLIMDQNINSDGSIPVKGITSANSENGIYDIVEWNLNGGTSDGPVTAMTFLYNATKDWTNVPPINYTYIGKSFKNSNFGYKSFVSKNGVGLINDVQFTGESLLRARMPIYSTDTTTEVTKKTNAPYLYDNLEPNGSTLPHGYWTLTSYNSSAARWVHRTGGLYDDDVKADPRAGVRPVITLPKNRLK